MRERLARLGRLNLLLGLGLVQWSQVFQCITDAVSRDEASPSVP